MPYGVTIGQAATFAGVTVKAVRHYHKLGLVPEPPRDASGYRRYGSEHLLRLVQVRTLAGAGVRLAEVGALLDGGAEQFTTALDDAKWNLEAQIAELTARRQMLDHLTEGDRALLPQEALALLEQMRAAGFDLDYIATQREALVLARALVPAGFEAFVALLQRRLDDPKYVELTKCSWAAEGWRVDDPRIAELAEAIAEHFLDNPDLLGDATNLRAWTRSQAQYGLINYHQQDRAPVSARLTALIETKLRAGGVSIPYS